MVRGCQGAVLITAPVARIAQSRPHRSLEDFTNRLAKVPLRFHPGDAYAYGFSTDVLGRVLEVLCQQSLEEVLAVPWQDPTGG